MSRSFLAAIRNAVVSAPEAMSSDKDEAGAFAPDANAHSGQEQENVMSDDPNKPGATTASGITQAAHDEAVAAARADGAAGAYGRIAAIVSADGIKGHPGRVAAAINLAVKSPGMSAEDVVSFVAESVPANEPKAAGMAAPSASLANRLAADGADPLAGADQPSADKAQAGWGKAVAQANARFGKDAA